MKSLYVISLYFQQGTKFQVLIPLLTTTFDSHSVCSGVKLEGFSAKKKKSRFSDFEEKTSNFFFKNPKYLAKKQYLY